MERLTVKRSDGRWAIANNDGATPIEQMMKLPHALARLAAYEDTGLEPKEIKEMCTDDVAEVAKMIRKMIESGEIDHLRELVQAEKDGRLHIGRCIECKQYDGLAVCKLIGDCGGTNFYCGWFESREEAEAALKGESHGKENP